MAQISSPHALVVVGGGGQPVVLQGPLGALFVRNMNNRGRNQLSVQATFQALRDASSDVRFLAYHTNPSGNFVLEASDGKPLELAALVGQEVIGLPCMARDYRDLGHATWLANWCEGFGCPQGKAGRCRVPFTELSPSLKVHVTINRRISISAWPTDQDVLCLYGRPDSGRHVPCPVLWAVERSNDPVSRDTEIWVASSNAILEPLRPSASRRIGGILTPPTASAAG